MTNTKDTRYLPVNPDFHDVIETVMEKNAFIVVHYFGPDHELCDTKGVMKRVITNQNHEEYLVLHTENMTVMPQPVWTVREEWIFRGMDL